MTQEPAMRLESVDQQWHNLIRTGENRKEEKVFQEFWIELLAGKAIETRGYFHQVPMKILEKG